MLSCVIVDDEKNGIEALKWKLESCKPALDIRATFQSAEVALSKIPELDFDILFLDIEMPGLTGFDLLQQLPNRNFSTIFVTAHDEYVLKALRASALDYLTKPASVEDLQGAIDRLKSQDSRYEYDSLYKLLQENLHSRKSRKVALATSESIKFVEESHITYCNSDSNYTTFHLLDGQKLLVSKTLKKSEEMLSSKFLRVHNSFLINLEHVDAYHRGSGGSIRLKDGSLVPVSKSRRESVLERLKG